MRVKACVLAACSGFVMRAHSRGLVLPVHMARVHTRVYANETPFAQGYLMKVSRDSGCPGHSQSQAWLS
jgi:hypothetical protein